MMFTSVTKFCYVAALASATLAQNIFIALPPPNTQVTAGANTTVQLAKPMTLTGSEEVSVVIGAFPCTSGVCPGADEVLGTILYSGSYNPQLYADAWDPYQNITVTVPSWYNGLVQLGVAHFYLLGAGLSAQLQITNTTLDVVVKND